MIKRFVIFFCAVFLFGCSEKQPTVFTGTLIELTKQGNEFVIVKQCPGLDQKGIRISNGSLIEVYQMEYSKYAIGQIFGDKDSQFSIWTAGSTKNVYTFTWKDKAKGLILCEELPNGAEPKVVRYLVDSTKAAAFKVVGPFHCKD